MSEGKKTEIVATKVTEQKRDQLRELAFQRRTTMSGLLRDEIDALLDEADEVPAPDAGENIAD
jgi:hypothetical protein